MLAGGLSEIMSAKNYLKKERIERKWVVYLDVMNMTMMIIFIHGIIIIIDLIVVLHLIIVIVIIVVVKDILNNNQVQVNVIVDIKQVNIKEYKSLFYFSFLNKFL
jgi:hypothetical protein